ncbi:MAG TPA: OsmC family protein [Rhabdochlamydiaceae bacterium]|jgi:putative redox protein|nr:OsmC family protein [Rhabdochlamydiaceae bacterium]
MARIDIAYEGNLRTRCIHSGNKEEIVTDAPKDNQGKGEMFSPTDLLATALGSCVLTLIGIAGSRLKVNLQGLRLTVEKEMAQMPSRRIGRLVCHIYCPQIFDPAITQKLESAGSHCPVHQSLHPDTKQEFFFHWGES